MTAPNHALPTRIGRRPQVTAMAAVDTIDLLADRVQRLLSHDRHITLVGRWTDGDNTPDVRAGLTLRRELEVRRTTGGIVVTAYLHPAALANTFGFSASYGTEDTEAQAWEQYHHPSGDRRGLTHITMSGGLPGNGPALTDQIVIRHWNGNNRCWETVVAFDNNPAQALVAQARDKVQAMAEHWPITGHMRDELFAVAKLLEPQ